MFYSTRTRVYPARDSLLLHSSGGSHGGKSETAQFGAWVCSAYDAAYVLVQ